VLGAEVPVGKSLPAELAELVPSDQIDERGARVGVGGDDLARLDGAAILEPYAGRASVRGQYLDHRAVVTEIGAGVQRRARHRVRKRVRSADRHVVIAAQPDHRHHETEPVARVQVRAPLDALAVQRRAHLVRLEDLVDQHLGALVQLLWIEAQLDPQLQQPARGHLVAAVAGHLVRGRAVEHRGDVLVVLHHLAADLGEGVGVAARVVRDAGVSLVGEFGPVDDQRRAPVGERDSDLRIGFDHARAEAGQIAIAPDRHVVDELHVLGMEVVPEARHGRLVGVRAAAFVVAPLEHPDRHSRAREVSGETEPVVARADYHRIITCVWHTDLL
jgi:hypothetical protein